MTRVKINCSFVCFRLYDQLPKTRPLPDKDMEALAGDQGQSETKSLFQIQEVEEQMV